MSNKTIDREFKKKSQFISGMKILIAKNKRQSGACLNEMKNAISFEAHKSYVKNFIREKVKTICLQMPS